MADLKSKGTAVFKDTGGLLSWYKSLGLDHAKQLYSAYNEMFDPRSRSLSTMEQLVKSALNLSFQVTGGWASHPPSETEAAKWPQCLEKTVSRVTRVIEYSTKFDQSVNIGWWEPEKFAYLYIGNPAKGIIIPDPEKWLEYTPMENYDDITPLEIRTRLGITAAQNEKAIIPADAEASLTVTSIRSQKMELETQIAALSQEMDDARNAKTGELAEIQKRLDTLKSELEEKKTAMMSILREKMAEMERMKSDLEGQIYLIDSQIYAIRCYAGETVKFAKIRSGTDAPDDEPIVVHQKLAFLDEDLGRLASLYQIQWDEVSMFEEFLRHSPLALDTFAPNERCIKLVRLSRNAKDQGIDEKRPFSNILVDYDYYHGRTVGIIIRNGENLYFGWTEEGRINIKDDLIFSSIVTTVAAAPEVLSDSELEKERLSKQELARGLISRAFIFNIVQGVVDHSNILPLPSGVTLSKQSPYVLYAVADRWLADNRFGSFTEIIERCNKKLTEGDSILTVQRLVPEHGISSWSRWENTRGRGERNRTHDCAISDCTIYPINLLERENPTKMVRYTNKDFMGGTHEYTGHAIDIERRAKESPGEYEILEYYDRINQHIFVSVEKEEKRWDRYVGADPRANFEVYSSEFINLTYMNSIWLEWVITNKTLGDWRVGRNAVDYAYAIRYLKTALDFIREREAQEKIFIDTVDSSICNNPNWPLMLSEWKLAKGVRTITPFQAKRFVKSICNKK